MTAHHVEENVYRNFLELFDSGNNTKNKTDQHDDEPVTQHTPLQKITVIFVYILFIR